MNKQFDLFFAENRKVRLRLKQNQYGRKGTSPPSGGDFNCGHCRHPVSADPFLSGVNNRNHCPYCLYSRHLDLYEAGDRLSACKSLMGPVGLTLKRTRKKYGPGRGELMLVHQCVECGKLSINRIAADDNVDAALAVYENSIRLDCSMRASFESCGIEPLQAADEELIYAQLFGERSLSGLSLVD
jgi:hypothetical protein